MRPKEYNLKQLTTLVLIAVLLLSTSASDARNTLHRIPIDQAMAQAEAKTRLDPSIRLFFGDQAHPPVARTLGTFTANKKTNAVGKSDQKACKWAFLSALISLQQRAVAEGGNAVINIRSFYYTNKFSSATEFECGAGGLMAGVTMVGDVVELAD